VGNRRQTQNGFTEFFKKLAIFRLTKALKRKKRDLLKKAKGEKFI